MFGISGAAAGPLLLAGWSPHAGYLVFLAYTAFALALGGVAGSRPRGRIEVVKP
jgi:hypothetical protein